MKRFTAVILVIMTALTLGPAVWAVTKASEMTESVGRADGGTLTGLVTEVTEDGFALASDEGTVFVIVSDTTAWSTDAVPKAGDAVQVAYEGRTDRRSVNAASVTGYALNGTVTEVFAEDEEPYFLMEPEDGTDTVRVNFGSVPAENAAAGQTAEVWYNGMRTRSVPPQITALYVRGTVLRGTIGRVEDNGDILLMRDGGEEVVIHVSDRTIKAVEVKAGAPVRVSVGPAVTLSMPAQYEALDILPVTVE